MGAAGWMSWPTAGLHTTGEKPVEAIKGTKTYAAFKAGEKPPEFDPDDAVVANLVVGWKLQKVAVRINREQGLVENFKNGNVAFLEDVPERKIRYR